MTISVEALAQRLAAGATTATALIDACLARIDANAAAAACFLSLDRTGARAGAQALDALPRARWPTSGLAGLPIAHKDLFAQRDRLTTFGADPALHRRGTANASALARLTDAGAIDLGGLHMSEFAMGPAGFSATFGFIDNPTDPTRVSGGSSSGSAAAVAHGVVAAALGTDTGGSIRIPAAFCGVVSMKPTNGVVPVDGVQPVSTTLDCVGPIAADVAGVARMLDVLTIAAPMGATGPHERALGADPRALRVGMLAPSSLPVAPDATVGEAWSNAAGAIARAGISIVEVAFPDLLALNALAGLVFLSEAAAVHAAQLRRAPERIGPQVRERLLQGLLLPAAAYIGAMEARAAWCARWQRAIFGMCDVLLLPVTPTPAPLRAYYENNTDTGTILDFNGRLGSYTPAFNYLGLPVLAVPVGGTVGMQLVAAPQRDADALCIGAALERVLHA